MSQHEGLAYHPGKYDPPLEYSGFEVWLSRVPVERYFDARRANLPVEDAGALKRCSVEHPWSGAPQLRFTIGRIRLEAHDGDYEEMYTFGGSAAMTEEDSYTVCRVTSTAPFLPLSDDPQSPMALLESELEVILAQYRARWGSGEYAHLDRLSEIDPLTLFRASLQALEKRMARLLRVDTDDALRRAAQLAREMRQALARAGEWPADSRDLEEIL